MYSFNDVGLCCGSLLQADFRGLAEAASKAGFSSISLWPTLFYPALEEGLSEQDMRTILADNGLHVTELDPLMSWLPLDLSADDMAGSFLAFSEDDFYRMADALGARSLNLIQQAESPISDTERTDLISALCGRAQSHGLTVSIEFLPWSPIGNLEVALDLVRSVGCENFGVNIDTWHHFRSGGTVNQLARVDSSLITAVQLNDTAETPWDNIIEETSMGRLLPGEGHSDTHAVLNALFSAGVDVPLNVEVFSSDLMSIPAQQAAKKMADSMRRLLSPAATKLGR